MVLPNSNAYLRVSFYTPLRLISGANPFPEVTDQFCRLPLPTLIYRLEAAHRTTPFMVLPNSNAYLRVSFYTPLRLISGANPFPEVTDQFCRLPLPTLIYRLEAAHLGYLLR